MEANGAIRLQPCRLRHERGLSQDDFANEAEVSRSYLSQLEKGQFHANLKIIGALVETLNGAAPRRRRFIRASTMRRRCSAR